MCTKGRDVINASLWLALTGNSWFTENNCKLRSLPRRGFSGLPVPLGKGEHADLFSVARVRPRTSKGITDLLLLNLVLLDAASPSKKDLRWLEVTGAIHLSGKKRTSGTYHEWKLISSTESFSGGHSLSSISLSAHYSLGTQPRCLQRCLELYLVLGHTQSTEWFSAATLSIVAHSKFCSLALVTLDTEWFSAWMTKVKSAL